MNFRDTYFQQFFLINYMMKNWAGIDIPND